MESDGLVWSLHRPSFAISHLKFDINDVTISIALAKDYSKRPRELRNYLYDS